MLTGIIESRRLIVEGASEIEAMTLAYYNLDEVEWIDVNEHKGVYNGKRYYKTLLEEPANFGTAYGFFEDAYADLLPSNVLMPTATSPFTVVVSLFPTAIGAGDYANHALMVRRGIGDSQVWAIGFDNNNKAFFSSNAATRIDLGEVSLNEWVNISVTFDGLVLKIYKNDTQVHQGNRSFIDATFHPVRLSLNNTKGLIGKIDYAWFASQVLTIDNIKKITNRTSETVVFPNPAPVIQDFTNIDTDGLIFSVNSKDQDSYPGTGNEWKNLTTGDVGTTSGEYDPVEQSIKADSGADYLQYTPGVNILASSDVSFGAYFRPNAWSASNPGFWRRDTSAVNFMILNGSSGRPWVRWAGTDILNATTGTQLVLGQYAYILFSVKSHTVSEPGWMKIYINGVEEYSVTHSKATVAMVITQLLRHNATQFIFADWREVHFYNKTKTAEQALYNYNKLIEYFNS